MIVKTPDIRAEVLRGMDCNGSHSFALVPQRLPRCLHSIDRDSALVSGARVYVALHTGGLANRSCCFCKV